MREYRNGLIAQSGGPSGVINSTLVGLIDGLASATGRVPRLFGSLNALEGCVERKVLDLYAQDRQNLMLIADTPGAALGSSRKKVGKDIPVEKVLNFIRKNDVKYFFYIGGNDSADNALTIYEEAKKVGHEISVYHLPKTVDNDLMENDHTPGFGSAAKYTACAFMGDDKDNRALKGIKINVVMGRHAGFLAASSALARQNPEDGPHLIYVPEIVFNKDKFLDDLRKVYEKLGRAVIAVAEGIEDENGIPIGSNGKRDSHGNYELEGSIVADRLAIFVRDSGLTKRVRTDVLGYIQRSFPLAVSQQDKKEARAVGEEAARLALTGHESCSIAIKRKNSSSNYDFYLEPVEINKVAKLTRKMPQEFIFSNGNDVTPAFIDYVAPLVGKLPRMALLESKYAQVNM